MKLFFHTLTLLLLSNFLFAQISQEDFRIYAKKDGLSSNNTTAFAQTLDGYLWVGTSDGLNRFDGHSFQVFKHMDNEPSSLSDNYVTSLFVDHMGVLWVGTKTKGLNKYLPESQTFEHFLHDDHDPNSITDSYITCITEDANQILWVGTSIGLNQYSRETNQLKRYFHDTEILIDQTCINRLLANNVPSEIIKKLQPLKSVIFPNMKQFSLALEKKLRTNKYNEVILQHVKTKMYGDHIQILQPDEKGNLWIGYMNNGLYYFNPHSGFLEKINPENSSTPIKNINALHLQGNDLWIGESTGLLKVLNLNSLQVKNIPFEEEPGSVEAILATHDHQLWVGTDIGEFALTDRKNQSKPLEKKFKQTASEYFAGKRFFEDREKNIWISLDQRGIKIIPNQKFSPITTHFKTQDVLSLESISALTEDHAGNLWIGYYSGGISIWDKNRQQITYHEPTGKSGQLGKGSVYSIFEDSNNSIWIGTYDGGLQQYDSTLHIFKNTDLAIETNNNERLDIRDIKEDEHGNLWMASHGQGLITYNPDTKKVAQLKANYLKWERSLANDWLYTLEIDPKGRIWIGSVSGITLYDPGQNVFKTYNEQNSNLSHNQVRCIFIDHEQQIWIGTEDGLNRTDIAFYGKFKTYNLASGISEPNITAISEDSSHRIWLSTKSGIYTYNKPSDTFLQERNNGHYDHNEIFHNAFSKGHDGKLYFGGNQGLISINPFPDNDNSSQLSLMIKNFTAYNQRDTISFAMTRERTIEIPHQLNNITLNYIAINLSNPNQTQYKHQLKGYDDQWIYDERNQSASYSNLKPGHYTFLLQATNKNGDWADAPLEIHLRITAPFWMTAEAYLIYISVVMAAILIFIFVRKQSSKSASVKSVHYGFTPPYAYQPVINLTPQKGIKLMPLIFNIDNEHKTLNRNTLPKLLIADNDKKQAYKLELTSNFRIEKAISEKEAIAEALRLEPDLIISRVSNQFDGIDLCHKLKVNPKTAFIPVMLIGSKFNEKTILQSMAAGADDYFQTSQKVVILKSKLINMARLKRNIEEHSHLLSNDILPSQEIHQEEDFLNTVHRIIKEHMADDSFGPNHLADMLHLSRSQLYKKVKKEFGQSVSILIRNIRLQKAVDLLTSSQLNITEIAYKVGFTDPGYFTRCFKNYYGQSPSEYLHREHR